MQELMLKINNGNSVICLVSDASIKHCRIKRAIVSVRKILLTGEYRFSTKEGEVWKYAIEVK